MWYLTFSSGSLDTCKSNAWAHNWDSAVVVTAAAEASEGKMAYTCQDCGATEYKTVPVSASVTCDGHETSGSGQINFKVNVADDYEVDKVEVRSGTYTNLKTVDEENNIYRITKVTSDLAVKVTTKLGDTGKSDTLEEDVSTGGDSETTVVDTSTTCITQKGIDGTALGKGASFEAADYAITHLKSDADLAGSIYSVLCARATKVTKASIKLTWKKASGAVKYVIYASKCGKKNKCTKVATVTKNTYTRKKLKKGTYYKFIVVALDSSNNVISTSKMVHAATGGGKTGNYKSVATVTKKGVIKAVSKGTCYVYVYAQSGIYKRVKVTVS